MSTTTVPKWSALERRTPAGFRVAGALFALASALMLVDLVPAVSIPGGVFVVTFVTGLVVTLLATLGLYPALAEERPRLARASVAPIVVAGVALPVIFAWAVAAAVVGEPLPPGSLALAVIVLIFLGVTLIGATSTVAEVPTRTTGLLLLALVGTWLAWFAGPLVWGPHSMPATWSPGFTVVTAALTLTIGYRHSPTAASG